MRNVPITSGELRDTEIPTARNGYAQIVVDQLLERAGDTIDDLHRQIGELHQAIAMVRAESSSVELPALPPAPAEQVLASWLTSLDPADLERHVQAAIAETMVEATLAARKIRQEAVDRVTVLADALAAETQRLMQLVDGARGSVAGMNRLPAELAAWQGAFAARMRTLFEQMQLPWTAQVSQVASLLTRVTGGQVPELGASTYKPPTVPAPTRGAGGTPPTLGQLLG